MEYVQISQIISDRYLKTVLGRWDNLIYLLII